MSRWFRVYDDLVDDPKVQRLPGETVKALLNLWCLASQNDGLLPAVDDIAFKLRMKPAKVVDLLSVLGECGLVDSDETGLRPHNWNGRQYVSDSSADRVQRYRDKRKSSGLPSLGDYTKFKAGLIARDGERCVYCETSGKMVVDHMVPIALGGTDHEDNLALACKPCNSGKSGRTPELANMVIRVTTAADALRRYRDSRSDVTVSVTPPENREQITETDSEQKAERRAKATRLPNDWIPSEKDLAFAVSKGLSTKQIETEALKFLNYWTSKSGQGATKIDWSKTWQNWILTATQGVPTNGRRTVQDAARDLHAETVAAVLAFDEPAPRGICDGTGDRPVRLLPSR